MSYTHRQDVVVAVLALAGTIMAGCGRNSQVPLPVSLAHNRGIVAPHANEADLAIAAVKGYKPIGSTKTIADVEAFDTLAASMYKVSFKDVGWGAQPQRNDWIVTWDLISGQQELRPQWLVTLHPKIAVKAMDPHSRSVESIAADLNK